MSPFLCLQRIFILPSDVTSFINCLFIPLRGNTWAFQSPNRTFQPTCQLLPREHDTAQRKPYWPYSTRWLIYALLQCLNINSRLKAKLLNCTEILHFLCYLKKLKISVLKNHQCTSERCNLKLVCGHLYIKEILLHYHYLDNF